MVRSSSSATSPLNPPSPSKMRESATLRLSRWPIKPSRSPLPTNNRAISWRSAHRSMPTWRPNPTHTAGTGLNEQPAAGSNSAAPVRSRSQILLQYWINQFKESDEKVRFLIGTEMQTTLARFNSLTEQLLADGDLSLADKLQLALLKISLIDGNLASYLQGRTSIDAKKSGGSRTSWFGFSREMQPSEFYVDSTPVYADHSNWSAGTGAGASISGYDTTYWNTQIGIEPNSGGYTLFAMDEHDDVPDVTVDELAEFLVSQFLWSSTEYRRDYLRKGFSLTEDQLDAWLMLRAEQFNDDARLAAQLTLELFDNTAGLLPMADGVLLGDALLSQGYYSDALGSSAANNRTLGLGISVGVQGGLAAAPFVFRGGVLLRQLGGTNEVVDLQQISKQYDSLIKKGDLESADALLKKFGLAPRIGTLAPAEGGLIRASSWTEFQQRTKGWFTKNTSFFSKRNPAADASQGYHWYKHARSTTDIPLLGTLPAVRGFLRRKTTTGFYRLNARPWQLQVNDSWLAGHIESGSRFRVISDMADPNNLTTTLRKSGEVVESVFARELRILQEVHGYRYVPDSSGLGGWLVPPGT